MEVSFYPYPGMFPLLFIDTSKEEKKTETEEN